VAACRELGRDLSSVRLSTHCEAYFPAHPADFPEPTRAQITAAQDPSGSFADEIDWVVGPTPDDAIRQLQPLIDLGVTLVTVYVHDRRTLERFAQEVIPAFGNGSGGSGLESSRTGTD
jgi:hypothetical protein